MSVLSRKNTSSLHEETAFAFLAAALYALNMPFSQLLLAAMLMIVFLSCLNTATPIFMPTRGKMKRIMTTLIQQMRVLIMIEPLYWGEFSCLSRNSLMD